MFTLKELIQATRGEILQEGSAKNVRGISINTQTCRERDAFIAIVGKTHDAHKFISKALRKGVKVLIVSKKIKAPHNVTVLKVKDTTLALGAIAHFHRKRFNLPIIAITGSAGKTSSKELIAKVLKTEKRVLKSERSENNPIGVPITLLKLKPSHDIAVLEVGTNQPGEIHYLAHLIEPQMAVFTNIGDAHLQGLKTRQGVFREKVQLCNALPPKGVIVYNADDAYLRHLKKRQKCRFLSYSIENKSLNKATHLKRIGLMSWQLVLKKKAYQVHTLSKKNLLNAIAAICCGSYYNISYNNINKALKQASGVQGRLKVIRKSRRILIDDSYNANPVSFQNAVETLNDVPALGKRIVICGDMLELGTHSRKFHERLGRWIAQMDFDAAIFYGKATQATHKILGRLNTKMVSYHFQTHQAIINYCLNNTHPHDVILIKGSRGMRLDIVVNGLVDNL